MKIDIILYRGHHLHVTMHRTQTNEETHEVIGYFGNMARAMKAIGISRSLAVKWEVILPSMQSALSSPATASCGWAWRITLLKEQDHSTQQAA